MLGCYFKTLFRYRPGLNRHDKLNLSDSAITDWEEANNASCVINTDYKILWVVNSENYIYKRNALNRAKQVREREIEIKKTVYLIFSFSDSLQRVHQEAQGLEQVARGVGQ